MSAGARRRAGGGAVLVVLMTLGSVGLWVGVPVAWLWVGGRVQGATGSLGAAVGVMIAGVAISIALVLPALARLDRRYGEISVARGRPPGRSIALEAILVITAAVAVVAFCVWFFVFAGANPFPFISAS